MNANFEMNVSSANPLLMNFTPFSQIEETEANRIVYNELHQIVEYDMRTVCTKSKKLSTTRKKNGTGKTAYYSCVSDAKNASDDSKTVK